MPRLRAETVRPVAIVMRGHDKEERIIAEFKIEERIGQPLLQYIEMMRKCPGVTRIQIAIDLPEAAPAAPARHGVRRVVPPHGSVEGDEHGPSPAP